MTLTEDARGIMDDFDAATSDEILKVLEEIKSGLKIQLTQEYLAGKLDAIRLADTEHEKKILCGKLRPYLDWKIQEG